MASSSGQDASLALSPAVANAVNYSGVAVAAISLAVGLVMLLIIAIQYRRYPQQVFRLCSSGPTMLLYASLAASIPFSIFWIISCSPAAANAVACKISMWGIVFFLNLIFGFLTLMLVLCAFLLSPWPKLAGRGYRYWYICCILVGSLGLSLIGIITGRFGYLADEETCWVTTPDIPGDPLAEMRSKYALLAIMIYGPLFLSLLVNTGLFTYVLVRLNKVWEDRNDIGLHSTQHISKALTRRVAFIPVAIGLHALLVIGGDLPILYHSSSAMFVSYFCNYIGFSSFTIFVAMCAAFMDPGFRNICRLNQAEIARASQLEAGRRFNQFGSYGYMEGINHSTSGGSPSDISMTLNSPKPSFSPTSSSGASIATRQSRKWTPTVSARELPLLPPARTDPLPQIPGTGRISLKDSEAAQSKSDVMLNNKTRSDSSTDPSLDTVTFLATPSHSARGRIWEPNFTSFAMLEDDESVGLQNQHTLQEAGRDHTH